MSPDGGSWAHTDTVHRQAETSEWEQTDQVIGESGVWTRREWSECWPVNIRPSEVTPSTAIWHSRRILNIEIDLGESNLTFSEIIKQYRAFKIENWTFLCHSWHFLWRYVLDWHVCDAAQGRRRTRDTCTFNYGDVTTPCTNIGIISSRRSIKEGRSYFVIFKSMIRIIVRGWWKGTESELTAFIKLSKHHL